MDFTERDMNPKYGIDGYSRYVLGDDGERYQVEPHPFFRWSSPFSSIYYKVMARIGVMRWHVGIWQYGGYAKANARGDEEIRRQEEEWERKRLADNSANAAASVLFWEYIEAAEGWEDEGGAPLPDDTEDQFWTT